MENKPITRTGKLHYKFSARTYDYKKLPWLNLSGVWLEKAGFNIGDKIAIIVSNGAITITVTEKAPVYKIELSREY